MDPAWYLYLNGLGTRAPGIGTLAIAVAQYGIVLYPLVLLGLWFRSAGEMERRRRVLLLAVFAAVLALGVNVVLNVAFPRPRPFLALPAQVLVAPRPHDASFPSDHAAFTSAIGTTLLLGRETGWGIPSLLGALLIGTSRIIVGVHYPSDILGGVLVGVACAVAALRAERRLRPVLDFVLRLARRLRLA
jgi:undecaprenyl-diphosphatase